MYFNAIAEPSAEPTNMGGLILGSIRDGCASWALSETDLAAMNVADLQTT